MLKKNKGSLTMGEFILIVGVLIAAFILFVYVRKFSFESAETARQSEVEGMARDIEEIGSRIYAESSFTSYLMDLPPMTKLSIRNGVLTVEKGKIKSSVLLPFIKDNITIENATRICIQKETDRVSIFADKCPNCNHDGDCEPEKGECEGCEDCRAPDGPSDECKGNERCDIEIGENCENTPEDCKCDEDEGYVCCPEAAHGDIGCTNDTDIPEGNPCFCDNQCIPGLKCNPTTPDFTDYNYACCPEGMAWNGTGCERYCDNDGTCEEWECFLDCEDCKNPDGTPSSICTNDHFCNPLIGENCETSGDCDCTSGVCCPEASDADEKGCSPTYNLDKGEECTCDSQCGGLVCNPTAPGFTDYEKACCPEGKSWNGTECIVSECRYPCTPGCILPEKWDWRNVSGINYLNPVRNQGHCGACWAFSAVGAVENTYNVEADCPHCNKDLSEQNLVSYGGECCSDCGDCSGGLPWSGLNFTKNHGICDEECFSYRASTTLCNVCTEYSQHLWRINNYEKVNPNIDEIKRALICHGPLSISSFNWGHAIVLVGYNDNSQTCEDKYGMSGCWIIRNSWGLVDGWLYGVWHERGYGYIPYFGHPYDDFIYYVYYAENVRKI